MEVFGRRKEKGKLYNHIAISKMIMGEKLVSTHRLVLRPTLASEVSLCSGQQLVHSNSQSAEHK